MRMLPDLGLVCSLVLCPLALAAWAQTPEAERYWPERGVRIAGGRLRARVPDRP